MKPNMRSRLLHGKQCAWSFSPSAFSVHFSLFRLVRACLGHSSIAERKLESGNPLVVLGIKISLDTQGATFAPSKDKCQKWIARMRGALAHGRLYHGEASKLAGALQWATQRIFRRMGRAVLRSIMAHAHGRSSAITAQLELSLNWWCEVLEKGITEQREWQRKRLRPVHLFCDARSTPPRVAAILFRDGQISFCDMQPDAKQLSYFTKRGDNQIMSLELLSIALGISTWSNQIEGRDLVIWSDNTGAEAATRKGATKQFDHNCLVHALWKRFAELRVQVSCVLSVVCKGRIFPLHYIVRFG